MTKVNTWMGMLVLWMTTSFVHAQSPCLSPPSCIINNELGAPAPSGDMNSTPGDQVNGWFVSHGTPTLFGNDCPTSTNACSVWMWSYSGTGEGMFTCFDFQAGVTYEVCLWARSTNAISNGGTLNIYGINNLVVPPISSSTITPPPLTGAQLIGNTFTNNQNWTQLTYQFVPTQNFTQLYIFPLMVNPPVNNLQYELQVDDIRVTPLPGTNLTISSSLGTTMNWCDSTQLCVNGVSTGASLIWSPALGLDNTVGNCVIAKPCSTTTYTAIVSVNACPVRCSIDVSDTLSFTLNITQPTVVATSNSPVPCGDTLQLSVSPMLTCTDINYTWSGPQGFTSSLMEPIIPGSSGLSAGLYSLAIDYNGCTIAATTDVQANAGLDLGPDIVLCDIATGAVLDAQIAGAEFLWNTGDTTASIVVSQPGTYFVNVDGGPNCQLSDTVIVTGELGGTALYLPNSFTPNGDGRNDCYQPFGANIIDFQMQIFNRWGALIYETTDYNTGCWNGELAGGLVQEDVYAVRVVYTTSCDLSQKQRFGHLVVVR